MEEHMYRNNFTAYTKVMLILLFIIPIMGCLEKKGGETGNSDPVIEESDLIYHGNNTSEAVNNAQIVANDSVARNISDDPFLLYYLRNSPTIKIDISENVAIQRIGYKNFETKEINFGDDDPGTFWKSVYMFDNGLFLGINDVSTDNNGILLSTYKKIEINREQNGSVESTDINRTRANIFLQHDVYNINGNVTVANDGLSRGAVYSVLVEEEAKLIYYRDYQDYVKVPDEPFMVISFDDEETIIDLYNFIGNRRVHSTRFHFINGILMKSEYLSSGTNNRTETYTVSSGVGEIIITNTAGEVTRRMKVERRVNAAGYLEYEAVIDPRGTGYEYFFTRDTIR